MKRREMLAALGTLGLAGAAAAAIVQEAKDEEGFTPLFNGKDLSGFVPFLDPRAQDADPAKTWQVKDGIIVCFGRPFGYLRTERMFGNFILRFEYRMVAPGNSGVFLMELPDRIWPKGIEFQLLYTEVGRIFGVAGGKVNATPVLQRPARVGEWNTYEIIHHNGFVATCLNGHIVAVGCDAEPRKGHLIFQSEGVEIHWRNIRIREL
ncbi:hypothetical protein HRbin17_01162 [bacterium HR17]|uniref:3-keto-alpha-glucoside-1,2-lyase/3-keto-2-hydroxy-glucal hydratase domain-containing protein n=1 Tax=Candidatus Fervidibacter japonicus TaxID=2035412 RepID=A0A2H5XBS8_9BACT|nr:hypothetical protein HRbin17_01162 [bacterium HR17]